MLAYAYKHAAKTPDALFYWWSIITPCYHMIYGWYLLACFDTPAEYLMPPLPDRCFDVVDVIRFMLKDYRLCAVRI